MHLLDLSASARSFEQSTMISDQPLVSRVIGNIARSIPTFLDKKAIAVSFDHRELIKKRRNILSFEQYELDGKYSLIGCMS